MRTSGYPPYPLIQFCTRATCSFPQSWWQEVIGNLTDEDIQRFVLDACRLRRWTFLSHKYDPPRENATRQMINCLETSIFMSDDEVEAFAQQAKAAADHFRNIPATQRNFGTAATQLLNDSPPN